MCAIAGFAGEFGLPSAFAIATISGNDALTFSRTEFDVSPPAATVTSVLFAPSTPNGTKQKISPSCTEISGAAIPAKSTRWNKGATRA